MDSLAAHWRALLAGERSGLGAAHAHPLGLPRGRLRSGEILVMHVPHQTNTIATRHAVRRSGARADGGWRTSGYGR